LLTLIKLDQYLGEAIDEGVVVSGSHDISGSARDQRMEYTKFMADAFEWNSPSE
jgi:hypothetical protein